MSSAVTMRWRAVIVGRASCGGGQGCGSVTLGHGHDPGRRVRDAGSTRPPYSGGQAVRTSGAPVGDDDGVLELGREVPGRDERPPVVGLVGPRRAVRQERLDGEHEALPQPRAVAVVLPAGDARLLPQVAAGAVAVEVLDHREAVAAGPALDGPADVAQRLAGAGGGEGVAVGEAGGVEQLAGDERHVADGRAGAGVGPVAVELGGHVDVEQVAVGEEAARPTGCRGPLRPSGSTHVAAGKPTVGGAGRAPWRSSTSRPTASSSAVETPGRGGGEHGVARLGDGPPGELQAGEVFVLVDGHGRHRTGADEVAPACPASRCWHHVTARTVSE